jgi:hypothetical protein
MLGVVVYEGDVTPLDGGRGLELDLRSHHDAGGQILQARVDVGGVDGGRLRITSIAGDKRQVVLDMRQSRAR